MKVILVGYPGSQCIVPVSKFLTGKYLWKSFDVTYLNYTGSISGWSAYVAGYLTALQDACIMFALDDYLIADRIDNEQYWDALEKVCENDVVCVKLCHSTPEEHAEYPVTTQYTLWDRKYLIELLLKVQTPWEFEIQGSMKFDKKVLHIPCLNYFTNSSISSRWKGVRLDGLKPEDIKFITDNGLI